MDDALTLSVLEVMHDKYQARPEMLEEIEARIRHIREHGEPRPSFLDQLREDWEKGIQEQIEFLKEEMGLLSEIALTTTDEEVRQLAEYHLRIEQEELKDIYREEVPEWLK